MQCKKGQVVKSPEIVTGLQMAVILGYFILEGQAIMEAVWKMIEISIDSINLPLKVAAETALAAFVFIMLRFMAGLVFILVITVIISCMAQTGPVWASESLTPSFNKINIINNAKNIFFNEECIFFVKKYTENFGLKFGFLLFA